MGLGNGRSIRNRRGLAARQHEKEFPGSGEKCIEPGNLVGLLFDQIGKQPQKLQFRVQALLHTAHFVEELENTVERLLFQFQRGKNVRGVCHRSRGPYVRRRIGVDDAEIELVVERLQGVVEVQNERLVICYARTFELHQVVVRRHQHEGRIKLFSARDFRVHKELSGRNRSDAAFARMRERVGRVPLLVEVEHQDAQPALERSIKGELAGHHGLSDTALLIHDRESLHLNLRSPSRRTSRPAWPRLPRAAPQRPTWRWRHGR